MKGPEVIFSDLGEAALLCEYPPAPLDLDRQRRVWSVAAALDALPGVTETIPGMNNLAVVFDPDLLPIEVVKDRALSAWSAGISGAGGAA